MSIPDFITCETDEGVEFKVDFGCGREDVGVYPQLNLDAIHNQIVDSVQAAEEDDEAEYLEHLIAKHEDIRRLEDYQ